MKIAKQASPSAAVKLDIYQCIHALIVTGIVFVWRFRFFLGQCGGIYSDRLNDVKYENSQRILPSLLLL